MICQAETIGEWYRSGVDFTQRDGSSHGAGHHVVQRHTATLHLEIEGLTTQVRNTAHFHVSSPSCHMQGGEAPIAGRDSTRPSLPCHGDLPTEPLIVALPYRRGPTKVGESF